VGPERKRERERERKVLLEGWKRGKGGLDIPIKGGRKGGRPGDKAGLGKIQGVTLKVRIRMGKKRGGRKGGRAERRWVWKISGSMAKASANAKTDRVARKKKKCDRD
jgi:hypothetical protein